MGRILPVFILLIAAGVFFGYAQPTYTGSVAELRATIMGYDKALAAAGEYRGREVLLKQQQEAIPSDDRARIQAFLPDGVDNVQLIVDLNALGSRSGIRLSGFDVETIEDDEETATPGRLAVEGEGLTDSLDIGVTGIGTYAAFRTFLEGVERSLRIMDLVELTITDSETGVYSYNMVFRIHWLR